jgi:hypothetical protein
MANAPIQYFRKEDFPEVADTVWAQRLFSKLNELSRQTTNNLDRNLSVAQNLAGFWWEGVVSHAVDPVEVLYPFAVNPAIPAITVKGATAIQGFPFSINNTITPKIIKGVFVAQSIDVTDTTKVPSPAMASSVAWAADVDRGIAKVKIFGINGMVLGRVYFVRLLLLSE